MADPDSMRAADADRESTLALLRAASVDGRLTLEELARRAEMVHGSRTHGELSAATADLAPAAPAFEQRDRERAILSSLVREGRWRLAPHNRFDAILGSVRLDLREAVLPGPEVEIELHAVLGAAEVMLPEGVVVEVAGAGVLSSAGTRIAGDPPPGAPVVRIRCGGALSSFNVRTRARA